MEQDAAIQYYDFFLYYKNLLEGKDSIRYTLSSCLGGDTLGMFSYYLSSPLNLLLYFFQRNNIAGFFSLLFALKSALSAMTMCIFLKGYFKDSLHPLFIILLSMCYSAMHYMFQQESNIMWLDGVYMMPLIMLGVHRAIQEHSTALLTVSTALMILFNWYSAGIVCIFSVFWFLFDCLNLFFTENGLPKAQKCIFIKSLSAYVVGMGLGVLISSFLFLPTVYTLLCGKGIHVANNSLFHGNLISAFLNCHIFSVSRKGVPALFCGNIVIISCIGLFFLSDLSRFKKALYFGMLFFCIFIFYYPPLFALFSLFNTATSYWYRYSFISCFFMIYLSACFFSRCNNVSCRILPLIAIGVSVIFLIFEYLKPTQDIDSVYLSCFILIGYASLIFLAFRQKRIFSVMLLLLILLQFKEFSFGGSFIDFNFSGKPNQSLVLSIPDAKGWQIHINNHLIEPDQLADCFMILPLTEGENHIERVYRIPFLREGIFISILASVVFILILTVSSPKNLKKRK